MSEPAVNREVSLESLVGQVADEFLGRQQRGERPDVEEYAARHPGAAAVLRKVLASLALLDLSLSADGAGAGPRPGEPVVGTLGDFRLVREVGRGGMGVVYEAEQVSLGRKVALKVLPFAATMDPRQLQRFQNEAKAAACLHHPHIVPVHSVGCERAVHFYAMQFIEGQSLAEVIRELRHLAGREPAEASALATGEWQPSGGSPEAYAPPPASRSVAPSTAKAGAFSTAHSAGGREYFRTVARLGVQAAEALDHAHQVGIVHRDVKPANLLVDARGHLWVADFGLAQMQKDTGLTMSGDLVGTLRYMSPEQAQAQRIPIDHRTDVYSLGVTLYELLTLEPAFPGQDRQELLRQIASEEAEAPRRINPAIPVELETVVLKAMAKNPVERYATMQELADDLQRFLRDEPIRARRPSVLQRARKWSRRHKSLVWAAAAVLAVALAAGALLLWREKEWAEARYLAEVQGRAAEAAERQRTEEARRRAVANLTKAREAVNEMLTEVGAHQLADVPQMEPLRRALLEKALRFYQGFLQEGGTDPSTRLGAAEAYGRMGSIYRQLGQHLQAEKAEQEAIGLLENLVAEFPAQPRYRAVLASTQYGSGLTFVHMGRPGESARAYQRSLELWQELAAEFPAVKRYQQAQLACQRHLTGLLQTAGRHPEAEEAIRQTLPVLEVLAKDDPTGASRVLLADTYADLGSLLSGTGRKQEAERFFRQALETRRQLTAEFPHRPDPWSALAHTHLGLGKLLCDKGRPEEAEILYQESIEITLKLMSDFPHTPVYRAGLAEAYVYLFRLLVADRRSEEAEQVYRQSLEVAQKLVADAPNRPWYRRLLMDNFRERGRMLAVMGQPEEAEKAYRQALAIGEKLLSDVPTEIHLRPRIANTYYRLGSLLKDTGRPQEAEAAYRQAMAIYEQVRAQSPSVVEYREVLASVYRELASLLTGGPHRPGVRDPGRAVELARRAVELDPKQRFSWSTLGAAQYRAGDWKAALQALEKSAELSQGGDSFDSFFLAMAHWQLGDRQQARRCYDQAVQWMAKHQPESKELRRFRAEAAGLLGITEKGN